MVMTRVMTGISRATVGLLPGLLYVRGSRFRIYPPSCAAYMSWLAEDCLLITGLH